MSEAVKAWEASGPCNINECGSCGGVHQAVEINPVNGSGMGGWTHWYACPTTGDPVGVCLLVEQGSDGGEKFIELGGGIIRNLRDATVRGRFIVMIGSVDTGKIKLTIDQKEWPVADYGDLLRMLKEQFEAFAGEVINQPIASPVEAALPGPAVNLFGDE